MFRTGTATGTINRDQPNRDSTFYSKSRWKLVNMETNYQEAACLLVYLCIGYLQAATTNPPPPPPHPPLPPTNCHVPRPCPVLVIIHRPCGLFGQICFDYIFVQQTCSNTEPCQPTNSNPTCIDTGSLEADEFTTVLDNEMSTIEFAPVDCVTAHGFVCRVLVPCESAGSFEEGDIPFDSEEGIFGINWITDNNVTPVDGGWSDWDPWVSGNCPVTCCTGIPLQSRIRRCDNPAAAGSGAECPGLHYELRSAPDTERCGSVDNQCPITCDSATSRYADTCRRCVNNYYQCVAEGATPRRVNCPEGQVWSQHMTGCVTPSFCNAVERF